MTETEFHCAHPPGKQVGALVLERAIGQGGEGIVYLAQHQSLGRVVVKEYWPSQIALRKPDGSVVPQVSKWQDLFRTGLDRFADIGRRMIALDPHQNIVKFHELIESDKTSYLVMQFIEGEQLAAAIDAGRFSTPKSIVKLADQLSSALLHLHEEKIWHRDIAPDNIIISNKNNRAIVVDFNAAKDLVFQVSQSIANLTKPGFSPPELYLAGPEAQAATVDIYSVSAVLYNAITGQKPLEAGRRAFDDTMPRLVDVAKGKAPHSMLTAIDAGLSVRLKDRPQSMAELRQMMGFDRDLDDLPVEGGKVVAGGDNVISGLLSGKNSAVSGRAAKWAGLALGLLLVVWGVYKLNGLGTPRPEEEATATAQATPSPRRLKFDAAVRELQELSPGMWIQSMSGKNKSKNMILRKDDFARFTIKYFNLEDKNPFNVKFSSKDVSVEYFPLGPEVFEFLSYGETARVYIDTNKLRVHGDPHLLALIPQLNIQEGSLIYAEVAVAPCVPADTPRPNVGNLRVPCMDGEWYGTYSYFDGTLDIGWKPTVTLTVEGASATLESSVIFDGVSYDYVQKCKISFGNDININNCAFSGGGDNLFFAKEIFELRFQNSNKLSGAGRTDAGYSIRRATFEKIR